MFLLEGRKQPQQPTIPSPVRPCTKPEACILHRWVIALRSLRPSGFVVSEEWLVLNCATCTVCPPCAGSNVGFGLSGAVGGGTRGAGIQPRRCGGWRDGVVDVAGLAPVQSAGSGTCNWGRKGGVGGLWSRFKMRWHRLTLSMNAPWRGIRGVEAPARGGACAGPRVWRQVQSRGRRQEGGCGAPSEAADAASGPAARSRLGAKWGARQAI